MMNTTEEEDRSHSVLLDLGSLAMTIALASEALAAAAEALAEAARVISNASGIFDPIPLAEDFSDAKRPTEVYEELDSCNESETNGGLSAQADPQSVSDQQGNLPGVLTPATPVSLDSSDTRSKVVIPPDMPQADRPPAPRPPRHDLKDDTSDENDTVKPEQNNKLDALPPSPVLSTSNGASPAWPPEAIVTGNPRAPPFPNFRAAMKSHMIPPGRNYINFDQASDALAFVAYLALQANRTVCMIPMQLMESYSILLKSLSHANVYRTYTPEQVNRVVGSRIDFFAPTSYNIVVTPSGEFVTNADSFKRAAPDCIIHWGVPSDARQYIDHVLAPLSSTTKTCVIVIGQPYFNGPAYGVGTYSNQVLDACFHASSPLQSLRQIASRLLPAIPTPAITVLQLIKLGRVAIASRNRKHNTNSLPIGHFYIVLDTANDIDIVPVIAYIATKHEKVICHVPSDSFLEGYQGLINLISNVNVIAPSPLVKGNQIKALTDRLKSEGSGILLRPIITAWNSYFSKSIANALLYCGAPVDLRVYLDECTTKVDHSYLVLTRSQYSNIQSQLASDQRIQQYPHIRRPDSIRPTDLLYDLRQKLVPYLK
ncbi:hypothetical protein V565_194680 [Rhizoctonia solani 123E]|uniref:Uncharacterized protein n=1 Tax=Rhizoctonia solani 123E TaxID=1423351 RepID=A0A074S908_9AGAM|nr:hypothetical protein V565_194680 [Rhizoctonia solani 123E]